MSSVSSEAQEDGGKSVNATAAPGEPPVMEPRQLALASAVAAAVAVVVLVVAVLPAEYGIDPTGLGRLTGFSRLSDDGAGPRLDFGAGGVRDVYGLTADWRVQEYSVFQQDGSTEGDYGESRVVMPLNLTNVTKVTARLVWAGGKAGSSAGGSELFSLQVVGPGARYSQLVQGANDPGLPGDLAVSLAWRPVPVPEWNATEGRFMMPVLPPDVSSRGDWEVVIRLIQADDSGSAGEWTLTVVAEVFEFLVTESEGPVGDSVRITLQAYEGVEYKFQVQEGATLRYAWNATGPVSWDFHGDTGPGASGATSHGTGTSTREGGDFVAPFSGRHGWYWVNDGDVPLTITLQTSGAYQILGVP